MYTNTYNKRFEHIITTIYELDTMILLIENKKINTQMQKTRDSLANEFVKMSKDIPIEHGIKTINKEIKYYCNGLVETYIEGIGRIQLQVPSFEFTFTKRDKITPSYKTMFRAGDYRTWRSTEKLNLLPMSASWLLNDYIKSKVNERPSTYKRNYYKTINELQDFIQTYDIDLSQYDDEYKRTIIKKASKLINQLYTNYNKAMSYCTNGHYAEEQMRNSDSNFSLRNYSKNYICVQTGNNIENIELIKSDDERVYLNRYIYNKLNKKDTNAYCNSLDSNNNLPYMNDAEIEKFIKIYNTTFDESLQTLITSNEKKQPITTLISIANDMAKDSAYIYFNGNHKSQEFDTKNPVYNKYGYACMYISYNETTHEYYESFSTDLYDLETAYYQNMPYEKYKLQNQNQFKCRIKAYSELIYAAKIMLANLEDIYRMLYTIPNENMHNWMIEKNIIKKDYCPKPHNNNTK